MGLLLSGFLYGSPMYHRLFFLHRLTCALLVAFAVAAPSSLADEPFRKSASADPRSYKDPRSASPSAAYPAQAASSAAKDQDARLSSGMESGRCDNAAPNACGATYERSAGHCQIEEGRCRSSQDSAADASCANQRCAVEKASCLVEAATQLQACLQSASGGSVDGSVSEGMEAPRQ